MNLLKTKYLGKFTEERDGVKVLVQKWESITTIPEHNAKIEDVINKLEATKVDETIEVGKKVDEKVALEDIEIIK